MALLSFRGISTPSLQAQGEQRRSSYFNNDRDIAQPPALCAFEREQLAELFAAREAIRATQDEARPLVVASPAESPKGENVFELEKRQQEPWARDKEKNRLAAIEGDKRRADEERERERAELRRRNAAREDLAPPPIAVTGGRSSAG